MDELNIYSQNVNGLNDKRKRQTVHNYLVKKHKGIILLQETHATKQQEKSYEDMVVQIVGVWLP